MSESTENTNAVERPMDASRSQLEQQRLARMTFAGVMVALVIIYLVRNADRFEDLQTETRYSELVEMVEPIQDTIEAVLLSGDAADIEFLDSGEAGLPDEVFVSEIGPDVVAGQYGMDAR